MEIVIMCVVTGLIGACTGLVFFKHEIPSFVALLFVAYVWIGRMSIHEELMRPTQEEFILGALVFLGAYFYSRFALELWTDIMRMMFEAEAEETAIANGEADVPSAPNDTKS